MIKTRCWLIQSKEYRSIFHRDPKAPILTANYLKNVLVNAKLKVKKFNESIAAFCESEYSHAFKDLSSIFLWRSFCSVKRVSNVKAGRASMM